MESPRLICQYHVNRRDRYWTAARPIINHNRKTITLQLTAVYMEVPEGYVAFVEELPGANIQSETLEEATDLDKPGDFKIETTDGGWRLTIIDWQNIPITIPISSNGTPQAAAD